MAQARILVVEDEGIVMLHLKKTLEGLGYDVAGIAASGDDAITKAMKVRPDLVLMDIVLKGVVDGIDAAEKIRSIFHIPVVYLTAHADEATLQRAKVTEPFGYVVKPFKERDLSIAIEFALYKAKAEAEKNRLVLRLKEALGNVETFGGTLPVCAECKRICAAEGSWIEVERYLEDCCGMEVNHSVCPDCLSKL